MPGDWSVCVTDTIERRVLAMHYKCHTVKKVLLFWLMFCQRLKQVDSRFSVCTEKLGLLNRFNDQAADRRTAVKRTCQIKWMLG
jgi:hypothetical protein